VRYQQELLLFFARGRGMIVAVLVVVLVVVGM
jgi:hypothetical protein